MEFFLICLQATARGERSFAKTQLNKEILSYPDCNLLGSKAFVRPSCLDKLTKQTQVFIWTIVFAKMFWDSFDRYK